jgi:SOS-response transcriptional repressors (RecA-mediated autopeptidases)
MVGYNIKKYRKLKKLTQIQLAEKLGVSNGLVGLWETNKRQPQSKELIKLSQLFEVPVDILLSDTPYFSNTETYEVNNEQILRPILGTVKAGYNMYCEENIEGYKPVDKNKAAGAETFWLRVKGDSMNAVGILEGSLVLVKKVLVENRQIAVVRINGDEATIKQVVFENDTVILQPRSTNPTHEVRILNKKDFEDGYAEIIGKVIDVSFDPNDML